MHGELPNIVTLVAEHFEGTPLAHFLLAWQDVIFSSIVVLLLSLFGLAVFFSAKKSSLVPSKIQNFAELLVSGLDTFVVSILGEHGRKFTPFIGTLFIYILAMNLIGLVPFFKSPSANWSITMALAICVFVYLQFTAVKELGVKGYLFHLMGSPKGILAFSVVIPILMLFIHVVAEFIRPFSLSLRLRSNLWGDEIILGFIAGFGLKGVPLLIFNSLIGLVAAIVQAVVFALLTTIYFALVLVHED